MATLTLPTLRPNGQGTLSSVNGSAGGVTNLHLEIDDDPDTPNVADYVKNSTDSSGDKTAFFLFDDMPSDFGGMVTLQVDCDIAVANFVNDTCTLFARMYKADETTVLTDEVQVATIAQTGLRSISFTGIVLGSKADWDGARLRLRWNYTRVTSADGGQLRLTAVELDGSYNDFTIHTGAATLSGTGALSASSFSSDHWVAAATLSGAGSLTASTAAFVNRVAAATLSGAGGLTASSAAFVNRSAAATMTGAGGLTASSAAFVNRSAAATLSGTGALSAAGISSDHWVAAATLSGIGSLTALANLLSKGIGCGKGYGGGSIAAMLYGGAVPCNDYVPGGSQSASESNVEEFCILEYGCAL